MACHGSMLREAHAVCLDLGMASISSRPRHEEIIWPVCTSRKREVLWHRETRAGETAKHRDRSVPAGKGRKISAGTTLAQVFCEPLPSGALAAGSLFPAVF